METIIDLITGLPVPDSEDEPVRQAAEALLLELGYARDQVGVDASRQVDNGGQPLRVGADLLVSLEGRPALLLRCARGSLVTREREAVAAARLITAPWPPLALVFNGAEGELLDTASGKVIASGAGVIPPPEELARLLAQRPPHAPSPAELAKAARVYHAFSFLQCPNQCTV